MHIRPTTEDDWAALKAIRLAALLDAPTAFGVSHRTAAAYTEAQWRERAATGGTAFWLAFDGEGEAQPAGMIGGAVDARGHYNLIGMWVRHDQRGTGMARRLVDAVKAHAVEGGHRCIVLDVAPDNARAARFYLNQGFVFIDEWEALESHPDIRVQKMTWQAAALAG